MGKLLSSRGASPGLMDPHRALSTGGRNGEILHQGSLNSRSFLREQSSLGALTEILW